MPARLRFYCRGSAQVEDVHAANREVKPLRRMIGRRWSEVTPGRWAWVPSGQPQEVDYHPDLAKACKDGDLWPADAATAKVLGVPFDPDFGGEHTETIKAFKARKAEEAEALAREAAAAAKKADAPKAPVGGKADF